MAIREGTAIFFTSHRTTFQVGVCLMFRISLAVLILAGLPTLFASAQAPQKKKLTEARKKQLARFAKIVKLEPVQFIKLYDKNKNQALDRTEAPKFLRKAFPRLDQDSNDKLDSTEVGRYLTYMRRYLARLQKEGPPATPKKTPPKTAKKQNPRAKFILQRIMAMDKNGDGKIARKEATKQLARAFDRLDRNNDGLLDQQEIQGLVQTILRNQRGPKGRPGFRGRPRRDFDSFDANANGRVTREELKGTPFAQQFAQMDADNNGYLTRREFENYSSKK